jgi:hypothetical protein
MLLKTVRVELHLPEGTAPSARTAAQRGAEEGAVLRLWQAGELSTRQAAEELGLLYADFLELATSHGIAIEQAPPDEDIIAAAARRLRPPLQ